MYVREGTGDSGNCAKRRAKGRSLYLPAVELGLGLGCAVRMGGRIEVITMVDPLLASTRPFPLNFCVLADLLAQLGRLRIGSNEKMGSDRSGCTETMDMLTRQYAFPTNMRTTGRRCRPMADVRCTEWREGRLWVDPTYQLMHWGCQTEKARHSREAAVSSPPPPDPQAAPDHPANSYPY